VSAEGSARVSDCCAGYESLFDFNGGRGQPPVVYPRPPFTFKSDPDQRESIERRNPTAHPASLRTLRETIRSAAQRQEQPKVVVGAQANGMVSRSSANLALP
jgi:hypothetical protein